MIFYTNIWLPLFPEKLKHLTQSLKTLNNTGPICRVAALAGAGESMYVALAVSLPLPLLYVLQCDLRLFCLAPVEIRVGEP